MPEDVFFCPPRWRGRDPTGRAGFLNSTSHSPGTLWLWRILIAATRLFFCLVGFLFLSAGFFWYSMFFLNPCKGAAFSWCASQSLHHQPEKQVWEICRGLWNQMCPENPGLDFQVLKKHHYSQFSDVTSLNPAWKLVLSLEVLMKAGKLPKRATVWWVVPDF